MRSYELTIIIDSETKKGDEEKLISKIKKVIEDGKGKIKKVDEWGKKKFAYSINKKEEGIYFVIFFESEPENVLDIEKKMKLEEKIIRHLLITDEGK